MWIFLIYYSGLVTAERIVGTSSVIANTDEIL
jgi:hypothetical protein